MGGGKGGATKRTQERQRMGKMRPTSSEDMQSHPGTNFQASWGARGLDGSSTRSDLHVVVKRWSLPFCVLCTILPRLRRCRPTRKNIYPAQTAHTTRNASFAGELFSTCPLPFERRCSGAALRALRRLSCPSRNMWGKNLGHRSGAANISTGAQERTAPTEVTHPECPGDCGTFGGLDFCPAASAKTQNSTCSFSRNLAVLKKGTKHFDGTRILTVKTRRAPNAVFRMSSTAAPQSALACQSQEASTSVFPQSLRQAFGRRTAAGFPRRRRPRSVH